MHTSFRNFALAAGALGALTFASCGEDDTPIIPETPNRAPSVTLQGANGGDFDDDQTDLDVVANNNIDVTVSASDPDGNLNSISFLRNGVLVQPNTGFVRTVNADGSASTLASATLATVDMSNYLQTFRFAVPGDFGQTATYSVIVSDVGTPALTDTATFSFSTIDEPIERDSVETVNAAFFFNRLGTGFGSLDLVTGDSIASNNTSAQSRLQDAGNGTGTAWAQVLIGEGDVQIYRFDNGTPDGFDFDDIQFEDQFDSIFEGGSTFDVDNVEQNRTRKLNQGDVFFARSADRLYIVRVANVEPNQGPGNNKGRWSLEYKSAPRS